MVRTQFLGATFCLLIAVGQISAAFAAPPRFKNKIDVRRMETCGHARGGQMVYLVNTDKNNAYRVTVKTSYRQLSNEGSANEPIDIDAGAEKGLGCSISFDIPVTSYRREVVGERIRNP